MNCKECLYWVASEEEETIGHCHYNPVPVQKAPDDFCSKLEEHHGDDPSPSDRCPFSNRLCLSSCPLYIVYIEGDDYCSFKALAKEIKSISDNGISNYPQS